ncbi:hypothetical protein ABWU93_11645 [Xanthomonas translucens pv. translucens]|uniref:hypothetical protein n=1 Tax=Xanthomonas campestris pv. translucens TaxID=343 RepID=UPI003F71C01E
MLNVSVYIPGIARPHVVLADSEEAGIADALYALGLHFVPEGTAVTTEPVGDSDFSLTSR